MGKAADESSAADPAAPKAVKKSGVAKAAGPDGAASPKKKLTAAEAKKKLKAGKAAKAEGSKIGAAVGDDGKKKPMPNMNLPRDLSKQVGLKRDGDPDVGGEAALRPKHDRNVAIHTTGRDARETRKVRLLLAGGLLLAVGAIVGLVLLQLRDPEAGGKAHLLTLEMNHYRAALAQHPTPNTGADGKVSPAAVMAALAPILEQQYAARQPDPKAVVSATDNPELYSLDLARQFLDPYGQPIRVGVVDGKIVIRSLGADGQDQSGGQATEAKGDDQVVSE